MSLTRARTPRQASVNIFFLLDSHALARPSAAVQSHSHLIKLMICKKVPFNSSVVWVCTANEYSRGGRRCEVETNKWHLFFYFMISFFFFISFYFLFTGFSVRIKRFVLDKYNGKENLQLVCFLVLYNRMTSFFRFGLFSHCFFFIHMARGRTKGFIALSRQSES